jgi:ABC-type bacteriocin/lantibiotic exporter with double-glycine peptidase domain
MAAWLVTNFVWVAIAIVVIIVGAKFVIGAVLKRLMDQSAAEAARRGETMDPQKPPRE